MKKCFLILNLFVVSNILFSCVSSQLNTTEKIDNTTCVYKLDGKNRDCITEDIYEFSAITNNKTIQNIDYFIQKNHPIKVNYLSWEYFGDTSKFNFIKIFHCEDKNNVAELNDSCKLIFESKESKGTLKGKDLKLFENTNENDILYPNRGSDSIA